MKTCNKCGQQKPKSEFYRHTGCADNLKKACKDCCREDMNKRYDPEVYKDRRLKAKYGISLDDLNAMREAQGYCCAICGCHEDDSKTATGTGLVVDHCHSDGHVRGLLCTNCNLALGYLQDDVEVAAKAISYLLERG